MPFRFGLVFLLTFAVLVGGFEASRGSAFERFIVETLILRPTTVLINLVTPGEHVILVGRTLESPTGSSLHVTRGCEGIEMFLLLIAALISFPTTVASKIQGLLWGSLLAYGLSIARLMSLHYTLQHSPQLWEMLHGFMLPLVPILLMALFFSYWSGRVST